MVVPAVVVSVVVVVPAVVVWVVVPAVVVMLVVVVPAVPAVVVSVVVVAPAVVEAVVIVGNGEQAGEQMEMGDQIPIMEDGHPVMVTLHRLEILTPGNGL